MSDEEKAGAPTGISRRTVTKAAVWAVPAVAVAAAVPIASASVPPPPPPPGVNWAGACATVGNGAGCSGNSKALQVPVTLTNLSGADLIFQVTESRSANGSTLPGPNVGGIVGIYKNTGSQVSCGSPIGVSTCNSTNPQYQNIGNVLVPNGTTSMSLWLAFSSMQNSSNFVGEIQYQWVLANASGGSAQCSIVGKGSSQTSAAISPNNCK